MSTGNLRYVQIDSWHLIKNLFSSRAGIPMVETRCGITQQWDQTFLDRLPGGDEKSCENCLILLAADVDEPEIKTRKSRKAK